MVPPRVLLLDIAGPLEVLKVASRIGSVVKYRFCFVAPDADVTSSLGLMLGSLGPLPDEVQTGAIILVPGSADPEPADGFDHQADAAREAVIVAWLQRIVRPGVRLVTICSGAILAGRAGLLDGYACTTHHESIAELRAAAPRAKVLENRLYVEDRDRLTSAGITAGIDMMLAEVGRVAGPAVSIAVARHLVVYQRRAGADPQLSPYLCGRNHLHPVIHAVQDAIGADPTRPWTQSALAQLAATSARNLSRLFNEQTGLTIPDYINRQRVARARELLAGSRLSIEEVAVRAGFGSARQLRRAWNRLHDTPPSTTRQVDRHP